VIRQHVLEMPAPVVVGAHARSAAIRTSPGSRREARRLEVHTHIAIPGLLLELRQWLIAEQVTPSSSKPPAIAYVRPFPSAGGRVQRVPGQIGLDIHSHQDHY
jgi:hypothetical protein